MYSALLRLLPFDFRSEFESEMEQTFREQYRYVKHRKGTVGLLALWWETVAGIFTSWTPHVPTLLATDAADRVQ